MTHPKDWPVPRRVGIWLQLRGMFSWRMVRDSGVWAYYENSLTGERKAVDKGGCWQPIDWKWLAERGGRSISRTGDVTYF